MFYVMFCIAYSVVTYLNVSFSKLITCFSVWEERVDLSAIDSSKFCGLLRNGCII